MNGSGAVSACVFDLKNFTTRPKELRVFLGDSVELRRCVNQVASCPVSPARCTPVGMFAYRG